MTSGSRLRLSVRAFDVVTGPSRSASGEVVEELARTGVLLRSAEGDRVVDPALLAAVRGWASAAVRVDVSVRRGLDEVVTEGAIAPPLAVCVVRGRRGGALLDAVEVRLPGTGGLVGAVLDPVCGWASGSTDRVVDPAALPSARRTLWARVRGPGWTGLEHCRDDGTGWHRVTPAGDGRVRLHPVVRRDVARTLTSALTRALAGAAA